jgi:hypothetical protein
MRTSSIKNAASKHKRNAPDCHSIDQVMLLLLLIRVRAEGTACFQHPEALTGLPRANTAGKSGQQC